MSHYFPPRTLQSNQHEASCRSPSILDFHGTCYTLGGAHPDLPTWEVPQDFDLCHLTKWLPCLYQAKSVAPLLVSRSMPV